MPKNNLNSLLSIRLDTYFYVNTRNLNKHFPTSAKYSKQRTRHDHSYLDQTKTVSNTVNFSS